MPEIRRDVKGRVIPTNYLFGIDYGSEVDDYCAPQSDKKYSQIWQERAGK